MLEQQYHSLEKRVALDYLGQIEKLHSCAEYNKYRQAVMPLVAAGNKIIKDQEGCIVRGIHLVTAQGVDGDGETISQSANSVLLAEIPEYPSFLNGFVRISDIVIPESKENSRAVIPIKMQQKILSPAGRSIAFELPTINFDGTVERRQKIVVTGNYVLEDFLAPLEGGITVGDDRLIILVQPLWVQEIEDVFGFSQNHFPTDEGQVSFVAAVVKHIGTRMQEPELMQALKRAKKILQVKKS